MLILFNLKVNFFSNMGLARISLLKATKLHSLSHEGSSSSTEKKDIKGPTAKQPNTNFGHDAAWLAPGRLVPQGFDDLESIHSDGTEFGDVLSNGKIQFLVEWFTETRN